ncbi:hypothetical protein OIU77_028392 [Salix suchowensis]|uniref:Uncharacterized protein n=1 Tax=Salix suchowensis TaxID=1278906 RepID=A0ABQ9BHL8_9ROSI|nr:hypothetical protein OIU77_028392 [Salix suchowensis]
MAMIPSFFNNRSRDIIFDPLFSFDPFKDFSFPSSSLVPSREFSFHQHSHRLERDPRSPCLQS